MLHNQAKRYTYAMKKIIVLSLILSFLSLQAEAGVCTQKNIRNAQISTSALAFALTLRKAAWNPKTTNSESNLRKASLHADAILASVTEKDNPLALLSRLLSPIIESTESENTISRLSKEFWNNRTMLKIEGLTLVTAMLKELFNATSNNAIKQKLSHRMARRIIRTFAHTLIEGAIESANGIAYRHFYKELQCEKPEYKEIQEHSLHSMWQVLLTKIAHEVTGELIAQFVIDQDKALEKAIAAA